jgi:hypothetical protein
MDWQYARDVLPPRYAGDHSIACVASVKRVINLQGKTVDDLALDVFYNYADSRWYFTYNTGQPMAHAVYAWKPMALPLPAPRQA